MNSQAGIVKLIKKDGDDNIVDQQETYNKEMVDAIVASLLQTVDTKIAAALAAAQDD